MRDAEAIIRDLMPKIGESVLVIHQHPSEKSLEYYAVRHGVDRRYVQRSYRRAPTIFVVVNHEYGHTVAEIFRNNGLDIADYRALGLWRDYPMAHVYQYVLDTD